MTRKEYKRLCRQGKTKSYRLCRTGTILAMIALIIVIAGYFLIETSVDFSAVLLILALGFAMAIAGLITDMVGEALTTKGYKAYLNGQMNEAFKDARGSYILENQNGRLHSFTDADITNYLEEMFINPSQFVSLTAPKPQNGLRFIQAAMNGDDVELQLGLDTGGVKLVYKLCTRSECRKAFLYFFEGRFKPNLSEYQPVEFQ